MSVRLLGGARGGGPWAEDLVVALSYHSLDSLEKKNTNKIKLKKHAVVPGACSACRGSCHRQQSRDYDVVCVARCDQSHGR